MKNVLSLFANIGIAEVYLKEIGFNVVLANELDERRCRIYNEIYPESEIICGDINDLNIQKNIIKKSIVNNVNIIMATPPCQGMSNAGKMDKNDSRNKLIIPTINIIKAIMPDYVFIENVPQFINTTISIDDEDILIKDYINKELSDIYNFNYKVLNTNDYGVPQSRERVIFLISKKNVEQWDFPFPDSYKPTLFDAIGDLPSLDPIIKDGSKEDKETLFPDFDKKLKAAQSYSKYHIPPKHLKRQIIAMVHTPTGKSAFNNVEYYPIKENGERVKGFANTYKRQWWDKPAFTITMDNVKISSQNNVHPGNPLKNGTYSEPRVLTFLEIMRVMTLPDNWNLPSSAPLAFVRRIIGEGIPPLFIKKIFKKINEN